MEGLDGIPFGLALQRMIFGKELIFCFALGQDTLECSNLSG
jgi:hypothetical protein